MNGRGDFLFTAGQAVLVAIVAGLAVAHPDPAGIGALVLVSLTFVISLTISILRNR